MDRLAQITQRFQFLEHRCLLALTGRIASSQGIRRSAPVVEQIRRLIRQLLQTGRSPLHCFRRSLRWRACEEELPPESRTAYLSSIFTAPRDEKPTKARGA